MSENRMSGIRICKNSRHFLLAQTFFASAKCPKTRLMFCIPTTLSCLKIGAVWILEMQWNVENPNSENGKAQKTEQKVARQRRTTLTSKIRTSSASLDRFKYKKKKLYIKWSRLVEGNVWISKVWFAKCSLELGQKSNVREQNYVVPILTFHCTVE